MGQFERILRFSVQTASVVLGRLPITSFGTMTPNETRQSHSSLARSPKAGSACTNVMTTEGSLVATSTDLRTTS